LTFQTVNILLRSLDLTSNSWLAINHDFLITTSPEKHARGDLFALLR
jgi:hypothetical protein